MLPTILIVSLALGSGAAQEERANIPSAQTFAAMGDFMREAVLMKVASSSPYEQPAEVPEIIVLALSDPSLRVRALGLTSLWSMGMAQMAASQGGPQLKTRPPETSRVQPSLQQMLSDNDPKTRQMALDTLVVLGGKRLSPQLQELLIKQYSDSSDLVRSSVVARLREFSDGSAAVQQMIVAALGDPAARVQQHALIAVAGWKPAGVLPRVAALSESENVGVRHSAILALGRYGADAQPYLAMLERELQTETQPNVKQELERTIQTIRQGMVSAAPPKK